MLAAHETRQKSATRFPVLPHPLALPTTAAPAVMKRGPGGGSGLLPRLQRQDSGRSGAGGAGAGGAPSHSERTAAHPVKAARLEDVLRSLLASMCHWLLLTFAGLQDAMLAIGSLRRVVAFALTPRCRAAVLHRLLPPGKNSATWDSINYHVPEEARKLLLHGSLHALVHSPEVGIFCTVCVPLHGCLHSAWCVSLHQPARHTLPSVQVLHSKFSKQRLAAAELVTQRMLTDISDDQKVAGSLPAVGRILLQTGARDTAKFQQAAAAALANQLGASLLVRPSFPCKARSPRLRQSSAQQCRLTAHKLLARLRLRHSYAEQGFDCLQTAVILQDDTGKASNVFK